MKIVIREATVQDAKLIADISHQTFYETFAAQNEAADMQLFLNEQFTKGKLMLEVGQPEHRFLLACSGPEVVGYVKLRQGNAPQSLGTKNSLEVARLYVINRMIGKGVGKLLMQASLRFAKELKKEMVWLGVWEKNERAIDFYTKWGFEKFDETDFLLGTDLQRDWLMKKRL